MEDWRTTVRLMTPNCKMVTIDLEDAYHLVPVHLSNRKFLRFQWKDVTYEFTSLPFGLSTASYIFTKIIRPVIRSLRDKGFQSIVYLDDFLLLAESEKDCVRNVQASIDLLASLGFLINYKKSCLKPATRRKFLGFISDSVQQSIYLFPLKNGKNCCP